MFGGVHQGAAAIWRRLNVGGVLRRRRLEHLCRDRLAELDLPRPYNEEAWIKHVEQLVNWPIRVVYLTRELRQRAVAVNSEHVYGHTFALRDGYVIAIDPATTDDTRDLTIAHELAHIVWADLQPSDEAPSMDAFFRSQGEDIPEVVQFMLAGSGVSRQRGEWRRLFTRQPHCTKAADLEARLLEATQGLDAADAAAVRQLLFEQQQADETERSMEVRAEVTATLMASWGAPHDGDEDAVERFWRA